MSATYKPRLCHVVRGASGYGFHLHGEKGKTGQHIRKVEVDSPAELAGLKEGDRIIAVNGINVEEEDHHEVVARIKEKSGETTLLVVDLEAHNYFKDNNIAITEKLLNDTAIDGMASPPAEAEMPGMEEASTPSSNPPELRPRLCHLVRESNTFGFNLHSEKGKQGSFIRSVEPDGPSERAGLRAGDRIIEINGKNLEYERHNVIVGEIKGSGSEVDMLVVDVDTDNYFKELNVIPTAEHVSGPIPSKQMVVDSFVSEASEPAAVEKPKEQAPKPSSQTPVSAPTTNGTDLPDLDLATLKERSKASSRKKGAPQSNWNNRQAIFNNL